MTSVMPHLQRINPEELRFLGGNSRSLYFLKDFSNALAAVIEPRRLTQQTKRIGLKQEMRSCPRRLQGAVVEYDGALAIDSQDKDALYKKGVSLMARKRISRQFPSLMRS